MFYALDSELSLKLMYEFPQIAVEFDEIDGRIGDFVYRAKVEPFVGEPQRRSILRERRAAHDAEPHLGIVTVGGMTEEISGCRRSSESRDVGCYFFAQLPIVEPLARQFITRSSRAWVVRCECQTIAAVISVSFIRS